MCGIILTVDKKVNISTESGADVQEVNAAVSRRLRALRRERGLSLDELSRRSGVSKGMLVEIEKGEANPSIATLCRAAAALGVSVAEIVEVAERLPIRVVSPDDAPVLWRGPSGGTAVLLVGTSGPDMIELWRWTLKPGESHDSPAHPPGTTELLHIERGVLTLRLEDREPTQIGAGHSALARTDVDHSYANTESQGEVVFLMTVAELHTRRSA